MSDIQQVFFEYVLCSNSVLGPGDTKNDQNICSSYSKGACILLGEHIIHQPTSNMSGGTDVMKEN